MNTNFPLVREGQRLVFPSLIFAATLVLCLSFANTLRADHSPKECYEMIGNPQVDSPEQHHAYYVLQSESNICGQRGNPDANYYLAECYLSGKTGEGGPDYARNQHGFPPNRPEAYKLALPLYENAAKFDHVPSLLKLSALYADGKYVPKDSGKSFACLVQAAKLHDKSALDRLSTLYSAGFSGVTDENQKFVGLEALADGGYGDAQVELSKRLITNNSQSDFDKAKALLSPSADKGNSSAVALLKEIESRQNAALADAQKLAANEAAQKESAAKQKVLDDEKAKSDSKTADVLLSVFALAFIGSLLLSIPGIIWGLKEKVVVYNGNFDLMLSFLIPVFAVLAFPDFGFGAGISWTLKVFSVSLLLYSIRRSFVANQSIGKTIVVVPTKFVLTGLITVCGLFAVGGTLAGLEALEKKKNKEALKNFAAGAAGAVGFFNLKKLIGKLVKVSPTQT